MKNKMNALIGLIAFAVIIYFISTHFEVFKNVLLVALGFGAVIMIHEFGHFIVAKLSGIEVEAFSIGFSPVLAGIKKTEDGIKIRILPQFFAKEDDPKNEDGSMCFTFGKKGKPGETEYRIGLLPFGGFVKMVGQEDTGAVEKDDNPRSFANKPILTRIAVVAAGVIFNAISAVLIFICVFLAGVDLPPAVVGSVIPNSPAQVAGIEPGDEFIEIEGETFLDFSSIPLAAALSDTNEPVQLKVRHENGLEEDLSIVAEKSTFDQSMRRFGIQPAETLVVEQVKDVNSLKKLGLLPGDVITAVNGLKISKDHELASIISRTLKPSVTVSVKRVDPQSGIEKNIFTNLTLEVPVINLDFESGYILSHVFSIVPRLQISPIEKNEKPSWIQKLKNWFASILKITPKNEIPAKVLIPGDILLKIADVDYPTYKELREITNNNENLPVVLTIERINPQGISEIKNITLIPEKDRSTDRVLIGVMPVFDFDHPVVAKTIDIDQGPDALQIPSGAVITAVDGTAVNSFYDIAEIIRKNKGQRITLDWRLDKQNAGDVVLDVPLDNDHITAEGVFKDTIPFKPLKRTYIASNPAQAASMGLKKTYMYIAQAYSTLKSLAQKNLGTSSLSGPLGIVSMSYTIVSKQPLVYYFYFLAIISSIIAVMNLLPLPILDGGVIVLLIIEKIKGSPISPKVQEIISYSGLIMIGVIMLLLTYQDLIRIIFRR